MEIRKNFQGFGVFTGTVQSYDAASGYFKIQYEDGDSEEVDFDEIRSIFKEMGGSSSKLEYSARRSNRGRPPKKRRRLDENLSEKSGTVIDFENDCRRSELDETLENGYFGALEGIQANGGCSGDEGRRKGLRKSTLEVPVRRSARKASSAAKCEDGLVSQDDDLGAFGKESILALSKPELPPSSTDLDLDGLNPFDLFSVYTCLRSFSRLLFLSPFNLETFMAALRCNYGNFLIDSIHFSILEALKPHLESLSEEGSQLASDCLRYLNWELLDLVTWPVFLVFYLVINRPEMKPGFRLSQLKLLDSEYYKQPAGVKLEILRCLCDDVIEADSIRSELNRRMESEINVDATCMNIDYQKRRKSSARIDPPAEVRLEGPDDGNIDECCLCAMDGSLICCDGCPAAFHSKCVGVAKDLLPEGDWFCPECLVEKGDGLRKLSKPSRGAELLGIDPHGRLYFVSCDRLLVSDSCDSDASYHYYNKNDLGAVVTVLKAFYAYSAIVNAISMCWVTVDTSSANNQSSNDIHVGIKDDIVTHMYSEPPLPSKRDGVSDDNAGSLAQENSVSSEQFEPKSSLISDAVRLSSDTVDELVAMNCPFSCSELLDEKIHAATSSQPSQETDTDCPMGSNAPSKQVISSKHTDLTVAPENCIDLQGWGCITDRNRSEAGELQYDPGNYINYYTFGRIASSIYAELMRKSSEAKNNELKKSLEDIKTAQLKAISNNSTKIFCYAYQSPSMDVQKENCGWCFSCRTSNDFDCLFNVAGDKNLEGSKNKDLKKSLDKNLEESRSQTVGPPSEKNTESHITTAMHYILSIEGRAGSLLSGPWEKPHHSQHWRKAVMKASDVASLKPLLLTLELNLRRVALSVEWTKPVDDARAIVSASIVTSPVRRASSYVGSRKQGKKNISTNEFSFTSRRATISDICWWRGGRLSRQLFQCKMLPRPLASKGGRQAGRRKIPHILYPDSSDLAKRSKYVAWRVAVEMSQSVAQLIYQAKDFDSNIKWAELSKTRSCPKLAKESQKMARSMKKVTICGKRKEGKQIKYLLDVSKRETVPPIVKKHGVLLEDSSSGRKRYWLSEAHVPLNLLKFYEEKKMKKKVARLLKKVHSGAHHVKDSGAHRVKDSGTHHVKENKCKMKKRKRSEWHSYLISKEQKSKKQLCGHCNKDVSVREAVNCQLCSGVFHRKHFRVPKGVITATYTCSRCRDTKTINIKEKDKRSVKVKDKDVKNVKAKERDIKSMNVVDRDISTLNIKIEGIKTMETKEKGMKRSARDKETKSTKVEDPCRRSERVRQKNIRSVKIETHGHKTVSKRRNISEGKKIENIPRKRKYILLKSKKKFNGQKRSKKGKSKNQFEKTLSGTSWHKRKRSVAHHSYWLNGLLWTRKPVTEQQSNFRERNIILPSQHTEDPVMKPLCCLCHKEYSSGVIYIGCERCQDWFHGDAFFLTVENINNLIGFRCHKCRMRSEPICPFLKHSLVGNADFDTERKIGAKILGNDHQNDEGKHCDNSIVRKEDRLEDGQTKNACVEHQNDKDKDHGSLHDCLDTIHTEDHLAEEKHCGGSIVCQEDQLDDEQIEDACVEHQTEEEKDRGSLLEDCLSTIHSEDHLAVLHSENVSEEELGLCFQTQVTNGYIVGHQHGNNLENSHGGVREVCSTIVQSQDRIVEEQRDHVILHQGEPALCPETISTNMDNVQSTKQVEANVTSYQKSK